MVDLFNIADRRMRSTGHEQRKPSDYMGLYDICDMKKELSDHVQNPKLRFLRISTVAFFHF